MSDEQNEAIRKAFENPEVIVEAAVRGVEKALRVHKALGQSVAVWRDGKVVIVAPEEIELDKFGKQF